MKLYFQNFVLFFFLVHAVLLLGFLVDTLSFPQLRGFLYYTDLLVLPVIGITFVIHPDFRSMSTAHQKFYVLILAVVLFGFFWGAWFF